jgi:hypothetical protein
MKSFLRKLLFGESNIREFVTVSLNGGIHERVYLEVGEQLIDVTRFQWLFCLDPAVFGIWIAAGVPEVMRDKKAVFKLFFTRGDEKKGQKVKKGAVAVLTLDFFDKIEETEGTLLLLKVKDGSIRHIHPLRAWLIYFKFYKKPGFLFERLKTYAAAYSYPRKVRIISFKQDKDHHFFFPMDLLGEMAQPRRYIFGLRHTNKALREIMEAGKIVVSEVPGQYKSMIYELGKGHLSAPPSLDEVPFGVITTAKFGFVVPEWAESYKEIALLKTIDLGSHMLLFGEWLEETILKPETARLHHIHFFHFLHQRGRGRSYPLQ